MGRTRIGMAATAVVAALLLGTSAMSAFAQDSSETPAADGRETRQERHEEREAAFAAALAEELDLPVAQVQAAIDKVREEMRAAHEAERKAAFKARLDAAVAAGTLTQEQADAIQAAHDAGVFPLEGGPGGGPGRGPGRHGGPRGHARAGASA